MVDAFAGEHAESTRLRLTFLAVLVVSLFALLFARLWFLQVMAGPRFADAAESNAVRAFPVPAARGEIFAADGTPLVQNEYTTVVSVLPSEMGEREEEVLTDLGQMLSLPVDELRERVDASRVAALQPKPVAVDVPEDIVLYLHENRSTRFPGVYVENLPRRTYPQGRLAAHLVGYTGEISEEALATEQYEGYRAGQSIGQAGLELSMESTLQGTEGERLLEVDRQGSVVAELPGTLPTKGADLVTTIEPAAQVLVEGLLAQGIDEARRTEDRGSERDGGYFRAPAGAAVLIDVDTGEIPAMASYPTYEPSAFVGGIDTDYWQALQDESNHYPLLNRAVQASYPPGSVYKVVSASAALRRGYIEPGEALPCPPSFEWVGQRFRNYTTRDLGFMDVSTSLALSCDTFYYQLAQDMWEDEDRQRFRGEEVSEILPAESAAFGLGSATGVDLPGERAGVVPGRAWKREFWEAAKDTYCSKAQELPDGTYAQRVNEDLCENGARWRGGDAVNMSIGQGDVQTTPLQIAQVYAAVANGGTLYRPHVVEAVEHADGAAERVQPEVTGRLPTSPADLDIIQAGLHGVTESSGTAGNVFGGFEPKIAGKTGTAELKPKQPFAWFAGYNVEPIAGRRYAVVVLIEEGGGGSQTAAPVVREIFRGLTEQAAAAEAAVAADAADAADGTSS